MTYGRPHWQVVKSKGRYRSLYERKIAAYLTHKRVKFEYEAKAYRYLQPSLNGLVCPNCGPVRGLVEKRYTPDFSLPNGVVIEAKGVFTARDRNKLRAVVKQHPTLDLRILFMRDNVMKDTKEKLTYTQWARKYGIPAAIGPVVPDDWLASTNKPKKLQKAYVELNDDDTLVSDSALVDKPTDR